MPHSILVTTKTIKGKFTVYKGQICKSSFYSDQGVTDTTTSFVVTSMNITAPYLLTPRGNKYLQTLIDHFTNYAEVYQITDQTTETCAIIYETKVVTRHAIGSRLITEQGQTFMSSFFQEICKILGIITSRTSTYHPETNGTMRVAIAC
jgi:transposase InsO family protein